ncbi:AAA family ATPase [Rhodococcus hoagii]|nr:AAA family ATPase [Prescottella equi]
MPHLTSMTIGGLRGFSTLEKIEFAIPNGTPGSGLTILVGANNCGKSTVIEAIRAISRGNAPSYSTLKRNVPFGDKVDILANFTGGGTRHLTSVAPGSSETSWGSSSLQPSGIDIMIVPSRRGFAPQFGKVHDMERAQYLQNLQESSKRAQIMDSMFASRLFRIEKDPLNRKRFNSVLEKIMANMPEWTIDLTEDETYFIKFVAAGGYSHSSDGVGEGIVSLFSIADALYDSTQDSVIVIDEPELSLHPQYQRRLKAVLTEYSQDRQIVYTTHSPYFIDWSDIDHGAEIARVIKPNGGSSHIRQASREVLNDVARLRRSAANPHILGVSSSEVFFLDDDVILTEGQEDVVYFKLIDSHINESMNGTFYGFGAGGAGNISKLMRLLNSLGYQKVVAIYDGDKRDDAEKARTEFTHYHIEVLPADDIRTKKAEPARQEKIGLWNGQGIDASLVSATQEMYDRVNSYLQRPAHA